MKKMFFCFLCSLTILTANSLNEIRSSGVLKVGVDSNQAPFSKLIDCDFVGFEVNLANALSKYVFGNKSGRIEFIATNFEDGISSLQENKIDIFLNNMAITDDRKKLVDFSLPYFTVDIGLLTRKADNIKNFSDLKDKTILTFRDSTIESFLIENGFNNLKYCLTAGECYRMLKDGKGDAYADDDIMVLAFPVLDREVEVSIDNLGETQFVAVATRKYNKELLDAINKGIISLSKEGFFEEAFDNDLNPYFKGTVNKKYFLPAAIYKFLE
ncbi:MAG: transporter substrate-binding domain-containing protein [Campylobacteraceae bacterium]|nr:transporter substrate-binding domain-containing protein [Campylobacteraceae bacterium]